MAVKKMFVHKNIKKKVQEHTKGFEIKLITTIISGLFLAQTAVAHDFFSANDNYRNVQQKGGKDIVFTGKIFDEELDYPNGMIADSFTATNCSFTTKFLPLKNGNINIGSITIDNAKDILNENGNEFGSKYHDGNLVGIKMFQTSGASIGSVRISNSTLANSYGHHSFFNVEGSSKNFSLNDVFLENVTYVSNPSNRFTKYGIRIQESILSNPINSLRSINWILVT